MTIDEMRSRIEAIDGELAEVRTAAGAEPLSCAGAKERNKSADWKK